MMALLLRPLFLLLVSFPRSHGMAVRVPKSGGGRSPGSPDVLSTGSAEFDFAPPKPSEAKLTIVQVTDVYTLENFASLKTLLAQAKGQSAPGKVISMLTGDFLAPYLLSSIDKGTGMMNALAKTPIDILTWGNHEADIDHRTVCAHVRNFPGTWLNTNMQDHEAMDCQKPFDIVEVVSPDGRNKRRIGLVAVLSNDPGLYSQFKEPGAFGGATITDPWQTLAEYKQLLEGPEYNCDVVIPLQHTYVPDDHKTCRQFDFPVLLSGHDHHRVDEVVEGTRLLKPGLDAVYATLLELSWEDETSSRSPQVRATFVRSDHWDPDPELEEENERAYDVLAPLRNTELARVPPAFEPLSSVNSRGKVTTMGCLICSLLRSALTVTRRQRQNAVDAVLLMGGNIRGGAEYDVGSFFSLEMLEAEIKSDETVAVIDMPGRVLAEGIAATHSGEPIPGWMQYDIGIHEEYFDDGRPPVVTHVGGQPIDMERTYRVATKIGDLTNGQSKPFTDYFNAHPEVFPPKGAYANVHAELMGYFAKNLWRKIWEDISPTLNGLCEPADQCDPEGRLEALDLDNDGVLSVDEIHAALRDVVGLSVDDNEKSLAQFVHSFADTSGTGQVTLQDFEQFCEEMPQAYKRDEWRLSFSRSTVSTSVPFAAKT